MSVSGRRRKTLVEGTKIMTGIARNRGVWIGAGLAAGLMLVSGYGFASALDSSQEARAAAGDHQFYVWCTGTDDFSMTQNGGSAEEAQKAAYEKLKADGKSTCWPIWQGRKA